MADEPVTVTIADNSSQHRYEARVDGVLASYAAYSIAGDTITFEHTKTEPAFEGHGIAGHLAAFALDDVRARGLRVIARCPFFAGYIDRHPAYADLLASVPASRWRRPLA
jgi:predicted GNAT family acetyltransferase